MAEYIEREALEVALNHRLSFLMEENSEYDHYTSGYDEAVDTVENFPSAADVAPVVHKTPVTEVRTRTIAVYHEEIGVLAGDRSTLYRRNMVRVEIPYDHCPVCGATLCSRWHNFCGKCGARMDGGAEDG